MEETFQEFKNRITNNKGSLKHYKITGSWGIYDAYKHIRKNHWYNIGRPLKEGEFYAIIRGINDLLAENIANGKTVKFPKKMGVLELRKHKAGAFFVDGKLKINYPPDWSETLKLWYEDEEARRNKTILRLENPWVYSVKYLRFPATYENKMFYQFQLNTFIRRALKDNIKQGKIDTLW
jgi:hypothetical protein